MGGEEVRTTKVRAMVWLASVLPRFLSAAAPSLSPANTHNTLIMCVCVCVRRSHTAVPRFPHLANVPQPATKPKHVKRRDVEGRHGSPRGRQGRQEAGGRGPWRHQHALGTLCWRDLRRGQSAHREREEGGGAERKREEASVEKTKPESGRNRESRKHVSLPRLSPPPPPCWPFFRENTASSTTTPSPLNLIHVAGLFWWCKIPKRELSFDHPEGGRPPGPESSSPARAPARRTWASAGACNTLFRGRHRSSAPFDVGHHFAVLVRVVFVDDVAHHDPRIVGAHVDRVLLGGEERGGGG